MLNFDTLEFYKELVHAGIKEQAAEVIVKGFEESRKIDMSHLATKQDAEDIKRHTTELFNKLDKRFDLLEFKVSLIYKASAVILVSVIIPLVLKAFDYVVPRLMH